MNIQDIKFKATVNPTQNNLFTPAHKKYRITLSYKGRTIHFVYQCNPQYSKPTLEDCFECLVSDANAYNDFDSVDEFAREFGYDDMKQAKKIYRACQIQAEKLQYLLDNEFIELDSEGVFA